MTPALEAMILADLRARHLGPSRAIPRHKVMALFGIDSHNPTIDRAFRKWYSEIGIACCEHGLYAPRNFEDTEVCRKYLWAMMSPVYPLHPDRVRARMERIYRAFPKCRPAQGEQLWPQIP